MTDKKEHIRHSMKSTAPADCVTEIRIGNSVLVVSGFSSRAQRKPPPTKWLRCWKRKLLRKNRQYDGL